MLPKYMLDALCRVQKMLGTIQVCCCLVAIGPGNRVLLIFSTIISLSYALEGLVNYLDIVGF